MTGVLEGVHVAAFTHYAVGPRIVQFLGALGADVIKVEAPRGEDARTRIRDFDGRFGGASPSFVTMNRNQRTVALDLKTEGGRAAAHRLADSAAVLVQNFSPGTIERLGFGYDELKRTNPGLIYCPCSGFDPRGPKAKELGQDMLIQAASGMASLSGRGGMAPNPVGIFCVDGYTAMVNVIGILAALRHREHTGEGQLVHADMMSCALYMMMEEASYVLNVDPVTVKPGPYAGHVHSRCPYGAFDAKDGAFVLSVSGPEQLGVLVAELGLADKVGHLVTEAGQMRHRDEIGDALVTAFARLTRAEIEPMAAKAGIWMAPVRSLAEGLEDPAVVASELVGTHKSPFFPTYRYVKEPLTLEKTPVAQSRSAPGLGEHTVEVLGELGYSRTEIDALLASGAAVATPAA